MVKARMQYDERPILESDVDFSNTVSLTKQSDAVDCDVNVLFKRFERTGQLPNMIVRDATYGDFSNVPTYQEAVEVVRRADEQFQALDVSLRNRFDNDPSKFLAFVTDPANVDSLEEMGLLKPEVVAQREADRKKAADEATALATAKADGYERQLIEKVKKEILGK